MKKTFCFFLAALLLFSSVGCSSVNESPEPVYTPPQVAPEDREKTGELEFAGLYFALYNDFTCEVLGPSETAVLESTVTVPELCENYTVVRICKNAFAKSACSEILLPDTVTAIDEYAFQKSEIRKITLPASLKTLGTEAFDNCLKLEEVVFQSGVEEIPLAAFYGCSSLKRVVLPEGVRVIGEEAFASLTALEELSLPSTVEEIGPYAFWSSGTEALELVIPKGVKSIGEDAFKGIGPDSVTYEGTDESIRQILSRQTNLK